MHEIKVRMVAGSLVGALWAPAGCYSGMEAATEAGSSTSDASSGADGGSPGVTGDEPSVTSDGTTVTSDDAGDSSDDSGEPAETVDPSDTQEPPQQSLPPEIADPGPQVVDEDVELVVELAVDDPNDDPLRVWATGLPPGATWDEANTRLRFRPDFIQGDQAWTVTIVADDGEHRTQRDFTIEAVDTIRPPAPTITKVEEFDGFTRLTISQVTDEYLDSPGYAGRSFVAYASVPKSATVDAPAPVRITLHGFNGMPAVPGSGGEFRIDPHDPQNTYWWGYSEALSQSDPNAKPSDDVPDYTQRRVMHLLGWMLETYPEADPRRAYITGGSMGGAGAMTIGLWYARHFAFIGASIGQAIPRNHRPGRIAQLQGLWGASDRPLWDAIDLTRVLRDSAEARDQFVSTRHGKDDPTIHFGATVMASPLTGLGWYATLQSLGVGHFASWDEGAHGPADPVLGNNWWDKGFSPIHDATSFLRRDLAFPAFARSSADGDPGDGTGNGKQPWDVNEGFAGVLEVPGDTGWNGDIAGTLNRFLRWDTTQLVDTLDHFAVPLHVHSGDGQDPPKDGYPSLGDKFDGELPVVVDVTPRRLQAFRLRPGERVTWSFGAQSGEAEVDPTGTLRIPGLQLGLEWQTLELGRAP